MQLEVYSPAADSRPAPIQWNYEQLKSGLQDALAAYEGRVYTEETIGAAKKDRAGLNKLVKAIEDKRRELKTWCLEPYQQFEQQTGELVAMVKKQSSAIDEQVKTFENKRAEEKLDKIRAYYDTHHSDISLIVPYDRIHNPRWLNVTYDLKKIFGELDELSDRVHKDLALIEKNGTPYVTQVRDKYLQTLSVGTALTEKVRLEEADRRTKQFEEVQKNAAPPQQPAPLEAKSAPEVIEMDFRVWATPEQLAILKECLITNHIKYGRVPAAQKGSV